MKILVYISLLLLSTVCVGVVLDKYDISEFEILLFDTPGDGNSEKDSSENSEDDSEKDSVKLIQTAQLTFRKPCLYSHIILASNGHFMEIPQPPPEEI